MYRAVGLLSVLIMVLLGAGCAQITEQKKMLNMQDRTNMYRKAVRWGEYETAASYIRAQDDSLYSFDRDLYEHIRVTEMEIVAREVFETEGKVRVIAEIEFYHDAYSSVHELTDEQIWWYDEEIGLWFLDGALPDYASELNK